MIAKQHQHVKLDGHSEATILETLDIGVLRTDAKGTVAFANKSASFMLGIDSEALIGQKLETLLADPEHEVLEVIEYGAQPDRLDGEATLKGADSRNVAVRYSMHYLHDATQPGYLLALTDLTLEKRSESRDKLNEIALDSVANMIVITDREGLIQYVNREYCRVSGYEHYELLGTRPEFLDETGLNDPDVIRELKRKIAGGEVWEGILHNETKEGKHYYEEITITPLVESSEITHFVAVKKDITERVEKKRELNKARDDALRASEEMKTALIKAEEANKAKDRFLSNMSHELRTPLNAIIGFSQILISNQGIAESVKTYLEKIHISGKNLLELVNTILDFSKIESGKMDFKPEAVVLEALFQEILVLVEPLARKKQIELKIVKMEEAVLYADRQLLKQVFVNLLTNAIKFSPESSRVEVSCQQEPERTVFAVQDRGVGIDPESMKTLFDPFTQVAHHQQTALKGSGLGLSIVKNIVAMHRGKVWVESREGEGSTFFVALPNSQSV